MRRLFSLVLTAATIFVFSIGLVAATTFDVTTTADSGAGSLRDAITLANANPGLDTITFHIPGSGVHTIIPASDLPNITDPVIIDGYTQPGASPNTNPLTLGPGALGSNAVILIELSGSGGAAGAPGLGLNISAGNSTVRGLAINRFARSGINLEPADGNIIEGNFLGTDPTGTVDLGNSADGVRTTNSGNNRIGGTSPASRNVISGNLGDAVDFAQSSNNVVQGNLLGTDRTGTQPLGNHSTAISTNPGNSNTIGGLVPGAGNVISANTNANGIGLNNNSNGNLVQGNFIGTDVTGTVALGNDNSGVAVSLTSLNNTIGGTAAGAGNLIAFNGLPVNNRSGVDITDNSTGNTVLGNSIFSNAGLGINLGFNGADGVTPNDPGDADTGPNNLQNFPVLTSVKTSGGTTTIIGTLNSNANTMYRLEFFSNSEVDPSGFGEGQTFLISTNVTTDGSGNASFNVVLPQVATKVTSTATDPNGNTSEFSAPAPGQLTNISTRLRVLTGDNVLIGGMFIGGTDPKKVVLRAIGPSLANPPFNLTGVLADPTIEVHDGTGAIIGTNNNWKDSQQTEITSTGLSPTNDLESAILLTLPAPGSYTAIVRGNNGGTGVGLVEAYDVDLSANSKLINISTRGFVDTGDNVMIGGFVVGGAGGSAKVVVRAIGPSLFTQFQIQGPLADPILTVFDEHGMQIGQNDNWKSTQQSEIEATTLQPTNDLESAIVATLPGGSYTAIVRGVNNATGVGLVEVFNVQ